MKQSEKEQILANIENLLKMSFYDGPNDDDIKSECILDEDGNVDIWKNNGNSLYKFALEYPLRSKCYWGIGHLMQYIKIELDKI